MRWTKPRHGDRKTIRKFALFPIEIDFEVRWLERATVQMEYNYLFGWRYEKYIDKEEDV